MHRQHNYVCVVLYRWNKELHMEISPIDLYFLVLHLYIIGSRDERWCFDQPKLKMSMLLHSADSDYGFYRAIVKGVRIYPST